MHWLSRIDAWAVSGLPPARRHEGFAANLVALVLSPPALVFTLTFAALRHRLLFASLLLATVGLALVPLILRVTRSTVLAGHWLTFLLFQCLMVSTWISGGLFSGPFPALVTCVVSATIAAGPRGGIAWTVGIGVCTVVLAALQHHGLVPDSEFQGLTRIVLVSGTYLALFGAAWGMTLAAARVNERIVRDLEVARRQAEEASEAKSSFVSRMSHELRTPLNAIIGYAELLAEDAGTEQQRDLRQIQTAGVHLLAMVNDVLDLAKVEAGHLDLQIGRVELRVVIDAVASQLAPALAVRRNELVLDVAGEALAWADAVRVRQCLLNLAGNAAKFTSEGRVTIRVRDEGNWVRIVVEDTGIGIAPEHLARVFDPFVQAGPTIAQAFGGTGLGLSIVRQIATRLGGRVTATSAIGVGSSFTLELPRLPPG